jgi:hypothetical protein
MKLLKMKLSVFWHQDWMDPAPLAEPRALDRSGYYELMGQPRASQSGPLTAPWPPVKGQGFWERYLAQWRTLEAVKKDPAWRALVPLRVTAAPLQVQVEGEDANAASEGFIHPWGGSFAVHLNLTGQWADLPSAAARILELRREKCFALATDAGAELLRMDDLSTRGLDALRAHAAAASAGAVGDGFSVFALLAAVGEAAEFAPGTEATGVARFLHAVASFSPTWADDTVPAPAEAKAGGKRTGPASHLIYGTARGRAIWSPARFLISPQQWQLEQKQPGSAPRRTTVGCHHRNLTLASLQTEAMARFTSASAARLAAGTRLANEHGMLARCAAGRLGDLYQGLPNTYRSQSVRTQLDDGDHLAAINAIRATAAMSPIAKAGGPG